MTEAYDLAIIGGGSAGLTAAGMAARFGARVALAEKRRLGGDCTWSGCVPSKALLRAARTAQDMRSAGRFGIAPAGAEVDLKAVMTRVKQVVDEVYRHETPDVLRSQGISVFPGQSRFLDAHTLLVGDERLEARHFLIAAGARPIVPPIPGLERVSFLTYEGVWGMAELPRHMVVIGGGPIGCELAQAFRRLGSEVTIIEAGARILPRDEPAASAALSEVLAAEGVRLLPGTAAEGVRQEADGVHVSAGGEDLVTDALLVAVGRQPDLGGLDLERAGVTCTPHGIEVNDHLQTSRSHIYAAGDCTGGPQFTHYAGWQAAVAVRNALFPGAASGLLSTVPWTTFTDPEVAHVGLSGETARERHADAVTCHWPMADVDRARTDGDTRGFLQVVHRKSGHVLGVTIVAARAGEMIHEWVVAMEKGIGVGELAGMIHVYPTYSTAAVQAAADVRMAQLTGGFSGRVLRGLVRLMR